MQTISGRRQQANEEGLVEFCEPDRLSTFRLESLAPCGSWSKGSSREPLIHRIHAYPAKFPSFIARKCIEIGAANQSGTPRIGDFFCGCGTVGAEARISELEFWGCDINPVAVLIARTKSNSFSEQGVRDRLEAILSQYNRESNAYLTFPEAALARIKYWYPRKQIVALSRLMRAIHSAIPPRSPYRALFLTAFSNILKPTSRWLTKSIKPQIDPLKVPVDVKAAFDEQSRLLAKAYRDVSYPRGIANTVVRADILDPRTAPPDLDLIITSPPYVTSYEYADLHQLSALWLGFADDYRDLRARSIGTSSSAGSFASVIGDLNEIAQEAAFSLYGIDKRMATQVARYFWDMQKVCHKAFGALNENGIAFFVIGDTCYKGVSIQNAKHLGVSLLHAGFSSVEVTKRSISNKILTPYRDGKGRFSSKSTGRYVYAQEYIVMARK